MLENITDRPMDIIMQEGRVFLESIQRAPSIDQKFGMILAIADDGVRAWVAHNLFGDKLAGDLGFRTTMYHPKHDYGNSNFSGYFGLGEK